MFVPCSPESGNGSPKPSEWNSTARSSRDGSSILFASTSTGFFARRRMSRELLVAGRDARLRVDDEEDEVGLRDRGARLDGDLLRDRARVGDVDAARVDQQEALAVPLADELLAVAGRALHCVDDRRARGGEPVDQRRLADVREPDDRDRAAERRLQQPGLRLVRSSSTGRPARRSQRRGQPLRPAAAVHVGQPVEERHDAALDVGGRLLVAAPALRQPVVAHGLTHGDRARGEVPDAPELRAVDGDRDDRDVSPGSRSSRRPAGPCPGRPDAAACPRRRCRAPGPRAPRPHLAHGVAIGLAAPDPDRPVPGDVAAEARERAAPRSSRRS